MATTSSTTTGINAAGVTKIKNSINQYVENIQKGISVAASTANIEKAIKGSSSEASLRQMNKDLTMTLSNLMNNIKQYNTMLDTILANYKSSDASNATFTNVSKGLNK